MCCLFFTTQNSLSLYIIYNYSITWKIRFSRKYKVFDETIKMLSRIFDECDNLFHMWYKCLNIIKQENEDFISYIGTINSWIELFKIDKISKDIFKCLIFVQRLTTLKDKNINSRILTIMEQDPEITLQKVTEECHRLINVKHYNTHIKKKNISHVQRIKQQRVPKSKEKKLSMQSLQW